MSERHEQRRRAMHSSEHTYDVVRPDDTDAREGLFDVFDAGDCDDDECARLVADGRIRAASWEVL